MAADDEKKDSGRAGAFSPQRKIWEFTLTPQRQPADEPGNPGRFAPGSLRSAPPVRETAYRRHEEKKASEAERTKYLKRPLTLGEGIWDLWRGRQDRLIEDVFRGGIDSDFAFPDTGEGVARRNRGWAIEQLARRSRALPPPVIRWGVLTEVSADAGPFKIATFSAHGKSIEAVILEFSGVECNPVVGSMAVIFSPGDDGRAVAIVAPPPAQRADQQKPGEASFVDPLTGNVIQHRQDGSTIAKTAGLFRVNPSAGKKIVRLGDIGTHASVPKGTVTSASIDYMSEGVFVARVGDTFTCSDHGPNPILEGSSAHLNNGMGVARDGDHAACGAVLVASALKHLID